MRLLGINLFGILVFIILLHLSVFFFIDGSDDDYYLRFTTKRQSSLILGTSKAAQGICPDVFEEYFKNEDYEGPFFNYSFSEIGSPYGPNYYNSIQKKIDLLTTNGIFLVTVDPWSISKLKSNSSDDKGLFREKNLLPGNMYFTNLAYNLEYIYKNYRGRFINVFGRKNEHEATTYLNLNGWLRVNIDMAEGNVKKREAEKLHAYRKKLLKYDHSKIRLQYLVLTIEMLKRRGKVYLVHMPVGNAMRELEESYMPSFDSLMTSLSNNQNVPYFSFNKPNDYKMTDGNHLYWGSAKSFSKDLAIKILNYENSSSIY